VPAAAAAAVLVVLAGGWIAATSQAGAAATAPADRPAFDHGVHWAAGMVDCRACHEGMPDPTGTEGAWREATMPGGEVCLACHRSDPPPRLARPTDHADDRLAAHRTLPDLDARDCAVCHAASPTCATCHHGERDGFLAGRACWRERDHGRFTSPAARECAACHDLVADCNDCHRTLGVVPESHRHPRWEDTHMRWANRPDDCTVCHGRPSRVCTTCHG